MTGQIQLKGSTESERPLQLVFASAYRPIDNSLPLEREREGGEEAYELAIYCTENMNELAVLYSIIVVVFLNMNESNGVMGDVTRSNQYAFALFATATSLPSALLCGGYLHLHHNRVDRFKLY